MIGQRIGVSERAVSTRFARLIDEDLVRVIAVGNPHALGFRGIAWLGISLSDVATVEEVAEAFGRIPQVSYLVSVSGRFGPHGRARLP
jgi:Lrp/AsnC family transcriptional regulator for asnA, asnC and gidA